jgi:hypothetical protein
MKAELKAAVLATGSHLMVICEIGPAGAPRILADVGDVARFSDRNHFASGGRHRPDRRLQRQHSHHRSPVPEPPPGATCSTWPATSSSAVTPSPFLLPAQTRRRKTSREATRCLRRAAPEYRRGSGVSAAPPGGLGPRRPLCVCVTRMHQSTARETPHRRAMRGLQAESSPAAESVSSSPPWGVSC